MVVINLISNRSSILQKGGKGSLFDFELIDHRYRAFDGIECRLESLVIPLVTYLPTSSLGNQYVQV